MWGSEGDCIIEEPKFCKVDCREQLACRPPISSSMLPPERIAAAPADARDDARLLVMDRRGVARKHLRFRDLLDELPGASLLVLNDTRVLPARLRGRKPTGGAVEFLADAAHGKRPSGGRATERPIL